MTPRRVVVALVAFREAHGAFARAENNYSIAHAAHRARGSSFTQTMLHNREAAMRSAQGDLARRVDELADALDAVEAHEWLDEPNAVTVPS